MDSLAALLFQKTSFKIKPGFAVLTFFVAVFVLTKWLYPLANLFWGWTQKQLFLQRSFVFSGSIRFSIKSSPCFICSSFLLHRSALHGVLCKAGRTLSCPSFGNAIWLLFRAGRALLGFWLLPFIFLSLISSGSGAGR